MLKYLLLCLLATSQGISARPAHSVPGDLASHILIVTPQAQVHLEPALKYDAVAPTTFIQHLSPLARIAAPHDETIIYVPSGAAVDSASVSVARSAAAIAEPQRKQETKQYEQISQQIEQAQAAIQQGSSAIGPQLSEAASAAANAASNAGSGLFPALFPPAPGGSSMKEDKLKTDKIDYEALPALPSAALLSGAVEARRFYALTPAVSHVIDFVHAPVFVGPVSTIRARSISETENRESEKLSEIAPIIESLKSELPATAVKKEEEKKESEPAIEIPKIEADLIKDDRVLDKEPERERERERDIDVRPLKIEEEKKYEEKKVEIKQLEEKKIEEVKYEEKKYEEKKPEEKKVEEKKLVEKPLELIEKPQGLEKQALEKEQPLQLIQPQQQQQQPQIQERKEQSAEVERSEDIKEPEPQLQQKQLQPEKEIQSQQQQQELQAQQIEPELKLQRQIQAPQKQEKLLDKPDEKELKEKSIEIKEEKKAEEAQPQQQQQQLLKESYKKESVQIAEPELVKISAEAPEKEKLAQLPLQPQVSQRAAGGRIEGADVASVPVHPVVHDEPQQQKKSGVVPVDQAVVPVFVPQTKTV